MPRWQFVAVLMLGAALSIALAGLALGAAVLLSPWLRSAVAAVLVGDASLSPLWIAALVVGTGLLLAAGLIVGQMIVASLLVDREVAGIEAACREVEAALGPEAARKYLAHQQQAADHRVAFELRAVQARLAP